jgi:hypothetical protein
MARAVLPRPGKDGGIAMPAMQQLLVIVLLLAATVVFGYFYVKRAQARTNAKATSPEDKEQPAVFKAPMATEPPAPLRMGEAPAAQPPAEPSASAPASSRQTTDEGETTA